MFQRSLITFFVFLLLFDCIHAQKLNKADKATVSLLKSHISFLADDKLEGRRAGTKGEKLAADYISSQFKKYGLEAKGDNNTWFQSFDIYDGRQVNSPSHLIINGHDLKLNTEYFPFSYSPNATSESAVSFALAEAGVPWFMDLKDLIEENKENPHFDLNEAIIAKGRHAASKGSTALIVYNTSGLPDSLKFDAKDRTEPLKIPVLYISADAKKKFLTDEEGTYDVKMKVDIGPRMRKGANVVGFLNNNASNTIIIGAHYDHLGYGEDGNSLFRTGEKQIHNGADDNASGTAAVIELARLLKNSKLKSNNYLFVAFSAEELGLNGSKFFAEHSPVSLNTINYMINLDMVGRLNDSTRIVTIGGYGTSPLWSQIFSSMKDQRNLKFRFDSSGTGPSDHTSFYRKNVPVLFYFTNLHADYHKPTDDFNKINYPGELLILKNIMEVISVSNNKPKFAFLTTREQPMGTSTRFSVTLGIMPDYSYSGAGVRVDGVSDGKIAQKAGMKSGDVIIQLGEHNTSSVESYMQALSKFKKGDSTTVKYKRGNDIQEVQVQFQ
ncbi:MAG TPA: M28 family peptidase [Flavitalea sp.]|nr:M28 family peptidase [Flavitalea sp.]